MNLRHFLSRQTINKVSRFNGRRTPTWNYREVCTSRCISPLLHDDSRIRNPKSPVSHSFFFRSIHSGHETVPTGSIAVQTVSVDSEDDDGVINEFLSRFVWIMRGKLTEAYTDAEKKEIDAMLHIIVEKVVSEIEAGRFESFLDSTEASMSQDFSEDLWKTVWEVSNTVIEDMKKAKKKEKMKTFLQSEEVKDMARFAGEIGIRGDLLRELRFKWAREKLEDSEFYESLELLRQEAKEPETETETETETEAEAPEDNHNEEDDDQEISLPKRSGKIKYKIYGLDLSKPKWEQVAEHINESGESVWPQEPKPISGKSKIVTEKLLSLQVDDDPSSLLQEFIELQQPSKVDWISLLDKVKQQNDQLYFKISELLLDEETFQTTVRDYSQLMDAYAKNNQLQKAERIIEKMTEKGFEPDILTKTTMVHMYSKAGNLPLAKEAFESLKTLGFQPDLKVYNSMIMAYINAGDRKSTESLLRDLESQNHKPSEETYLQLLKSYAQNSDPIGASRIATRMEFAGYAPSHESNAYLVEAYSRKGNPDHARKHFDDIIKLGHKPDDSCIARMTSAYANKNLLDKGLQLLLKLEKDGIEFGDLTYAVLIDWFGKLQLVDEVEGILGNLKEKGVGVYLSLCDMYARGRDEKKALQALGVLEGNFGKLKGEEFERIISGLIAGGFKQDAERVHGIMVGQGFRVSEQLSVSLHAAQTFGRSRRPSMMR